MHNAGGIPKEMRPLINPIWNVIKKLAPAEQNPVNASSCNVYPEI